MPEGDTIYRTAVRLREVLVGQRIEAVASRDRWLQADRLTGRCIVSVEARGKHLLVHLEGAQVLHSHLGMTGSWHIYRPGQPWLKPQQRAALSLKTPGWICVCFSPKTLELLTESQLRGHAHLRRLGPDLVSDSVDLRHVVARFRVHDRAPIGEAVMNQSIASGIGNIYKSEVLFLTRTNPWTLVGELSDADLAGLARLGRDLMRRNRHGYPRRTRMQHDGPRFWVYGRVGKPCFVCGQRIAVRRQGDLGRSTFWCPSCQRASKEGML